MAIVNGKSGTFNISTENQYISGYVQWQETYDNATYLTTNKTKVTLTAYLHRTNVYTGPTYVTNKPAQRIAYFGSENVTSNSNVSLSIAGTSTGNGAYTQVYTATKEITHDSDGSKSISLGFFMTVYDELTAFEVPKTTKTVTLTTIPRASSISTVTGNTIGGSCTVNITRANANFTHQLWYKVANSGWYDAGSNIGTSKTFTIDIATAKQLPSSMSGTMQLRIITFNGSTQIGSDSYKDVTVNVPDYTPTISNIALTGNKLLDGAYVQGKSQVTVAITASSLHGADIKSYSTTIDGKTYSGSNFTSAILSTSGNKNASVTVTDTRNKSIKVDSGTITVYAYANPSITEFTLARQSDNPETVIATVKGTVSAINNKNAKNVSVTLNGVTKTITSSSYTINGSTTFTGVSTDNTYTAVAKITDSYTNVTKEAVLPTVAVTMDFHHSGTGVAFGKVSELSGYLDVAWNAQFSKYLIAKSTMFSPLIVNRANSDKEAAMRFENSNGVLGYIGMMGDINGGLRRWTANSGTSYLVLDAGNTKDFIIEQGTSDLWTYRKWNSGIVECWGNVSTTPTTVNGNNAITVNLPLTFVGTDYKVSITPAKAGMYISGVGDCATNGTVTHTTTSFTMSYKYNYGTAYAVSFNVEVKGKWK